jgi:very-short-patch-repair endonuclease
MDDRVEQVVAILQALERHLEFFDRALPALDAAQVLQGLLDKTSPPALRIRELVGAKVTVESESTPEHMILHLASVILIDGMALPASISAAYDHALTNECTRASDVQGMRSRCQSKFEANVIHKLEALYPSRSFQANTRIVDGLEMDLYFPALKLNIELDGPFHRARTARFFDSRRDQHLQKKGIHVHRVNIVRRTATSAVQEIVGVLSSFASSGGVRVPPRLKPYTHSRTGCTDPAVNPFPSIQITPLE